MGESSQLEVHVIASGSKGNCTVVKKGASVILHDAGISCRRIVNGLKELHIDMAQVEGIFVSHEHSDHIAGLQQLLKRFDIPVYTKMGTWREIQGKLDVPKHQLIPITKGSITLGNLTVEPFAVSHDAADPIGINVFSGTDKATVVTDTGIITDDILHRLDDTTLLVLEANYDPHMLQFGPYQPFLKQRVSGNFGHLSNEMAAQALLMMKRPDFMQVILAHRSENNNNPVLVTQTIGRMLVDGGVKIGPEMKLQHGQPNEIVSMRAVMKVEQK
ncbi:MBL fold metallo-hydrolase [Veillonella denticariosi]|uniref:MBL fold metallo-hydrolase n=1 Tax=Veillonella denticariosi TaxID=419208 RepID=UPI002493B075|nr:MBL fold metallo-hydrolase [Veillonella denticariosi]